jgi:hypothetical protein
MVAGRQTPFSQTIGTDAVLFSDKPESCGNGSGWAFTGSARIDLNDDRPNVRSLTTLVGLPMPNI